MIETPWNVIVIVPRSSLPFAFLGIVTFAHRHAAADAACSDNRRGAHSNGARDGSARKRAARIAAGDASPDGEALPATGRAGTAVAAPARSVSGFANAYS